jgi:hypothetical protein
MALLVAIAVLVLAPSASTSGSSTQPYPLLLERDGLRVYARQAGQPWGRCPRGARTLRQADLAVASRAVLLAVPRFYAREKQMDVRDARARAARLGSAVWTRAGLARSTCGSRTAGRTVAVAVAFPHVNWSASLSSAVFFVSRVGDGWIIWHQAH